MKRIWGWVLVGMVLMVGVGVGVAVYLRMHRVERESVAASAPAGEEKGENGEAGHVKLSEEQAKRAGIKVEKLEAGTVVPTVTLYGAVQEDPGASFTVRVERAGLVEGVGGKNWPDVGEMLADGTVVGSLVVRAVPADQIALASQRITLETQVATAASEMNAAKASVDAARASYERLKGLNAQDKNVSDRAVEEALTKLKAEEARVQTGEQTLKLGQAALAAMQSETSKGEKLPLTVVHGGEVVEVPVHPGEAVEAGQAILRVARFDRVIAAVALPTGAVISPEAKEARITAVGSERVLTGVRIGTGAATDPKTKGQVVMFRVSLGAGDMMLRPGTPVVAEVRAPGEALKGVVVPSEAVVRYLGKSWVYVAEGHAFERREVSLEHRSADGKDWFALEGFKGEEEVVTTGAGLLLSVEINAAFGGGGD